MSRRLESEVVVLVLVDRFFCFIVDERVARLVLLVLVRLYIEVDFGDLDSERLEVLGQGACLSGLCTAGEDPRRPDRGAAVEDEGLELDDLFSKLGLSLGERGVGVARGVGVKRVALGRRRAPSSAAFEPYSLTTFVSSESQSSSPAAKEPPCRPGRSALGASAELRRSVWSSQ